MNAFKLDVEPSEAIFEFEDSFESFDECKDAIRDVFPEYDEVESRFFHAEFCGLEWETEVG